MPCCSAGTNGVRERRTSGTTRELELERHLARERPALDVLLDALEAAFGDAEVRPFRLQVDADDSLRAALNAMVQSHTGVAVRVSDGDRYEGLVTLELLSKEIS